MVKSCTGVGGDYCTSCTDIWGREEDTHRRFHDNPPPFPYLNTHTTMTIGISPQSGGCIASTHMDSKDVPYP